MIVGLTSGAVTMNPIHPPALYVFILSILLPTIMRVAYEGDSVHSILALMLILFMVVILNSGRQLGGIFFKSLGQRYENFALVEMLTKEKARAENASREKSRFLATASHDLRQPLQALMLFSDAMQNMVREKEAKHLAGQIGKSVNALVEMFDELLDVSKLEAGIVDVRWKTFELQPLLDRLFMDFAPLAHSKGLNFKLPACDATEHDEQVACNVVVYSDPFLLERILRNLVSNAIRYTDSGGVELHCVCIDDKVSMKVVDTGIGIHAEAIPHIFEEYYQADNQHRDRRKGLGLGLAIVHRMENLLGYEISVKSELGVGSEFGFMVQKGKTEQQLAQPFIMSRDRHDVSGTVVVLVEDDPDIRQLIAGLMLDWGCTVFDAENADEAMRKVEIAQQSPELLVCDYRLPQGVTAIHVVKRMRELWGEDMPALVLTGDTAPQVLQEIRASGAVLLHKPIAPERLRSMMYFALHRES